MALGQDTTLCLKKNIPNIFSSNLSKHQVIFIIFAKSITEGLGNQKLVYFPTSPK